MKLSINIKTNCIPLKLITKPYKLYSNRINKSKKEIIKEYHKIKPKVFYENGLRHIESYEFEYQSYIKDRWVGKKILDVLQSEFIKKDKTEYIDKINKGKIKVNNALIDLDYILKRNDFLSESCIRRENPILEHNKIEIIYEDEDYLVVNKPNSWPVQGCSGYQFNTLMRILKDDYNYNELKTVHRIDKDTSGVQILAKNNASAEMFYKSMEAKLINKLYLCRIKGNFEYDTINVSKSISNEWKNDCGHRINMNIPKYAETFFEKIFYDASSNTSVIKAYPKTGRTHQIRIHLNYLGYPIANDPWYGGIIYNDFPIKDYYDHINSNKYCYKIWLHSLSYSFEKYKFTSGYPIWANKEYKLDYKF